MGLKDRCYRFQGRTPPKPGQRESVLDAATAKSDDAGVATIRLYDPIDSWGGDWGVSAKEFAQALDDLGPDVNEIRLHINCPGGEVFEGIAILNALRNHPAKVTAVVDGIAASAASFIAMAGDEVVMGRNAELMIHDAWGICIGSAADMRELGGRLDHLSDNIASIYAEKAGGTTADWRVPMLAETWYTADEAVEAGLADRVEAAQAKAENHFDLSVLTYGGRAAAPAPLPAIQDVDQKHTEGQASTSEATDDATAQAAAAAAAKDAEAMTAKAMRSITENAAQLNAF